MVALGATAPVAVAVGAAADQGFLLLVAAAAALEFMAQVEMELEGLALAQAAEVVHVEARVEAIRPVTLGAQEARMAAAAAAEVLLVLGARGGMVQFVLLAPEQHEHFLLLAQVLQQKAPLRIRKRGRIHGLHQQG
jgi:hypothetical protein